tara:strand:- start:15683 stop:15934 length:252 start_codon:yes stop_codon:yes gene_type:complete
MAKLPPKPKQDYSLNYRVKQKDGQWGNIKRAYGEWIGLDQVQKQINMLIRAYPRDIEISFGKDGMLLDYDGKEIESPMIFEKR